MPKNKNTLYVCFVMAWLLMACKTKTTFTILLPSHTNIYFKNTVPENDSLNILDYPNIYNGGGVGVADFNGDSLLDLYFVGNFVDDKLYLNKGNFQFQDITAAAGILKDDIWGRGVSVVDINQDGWMDIYLTGTLSPHSKQREHLLYVNQGCPKGQTPHFIESSKDYGLNDTSHSTQSYFFDYDHDGDLDLFLVNNVINPKEYTNIYRPKFLLGEHKNTDKLYRNDFDKNLNHPYFTDVSQQAGILIEGYGHAAAIADVNHDGWLDIYISNDFLSNDVLYINQKNGSFKNEIQSYLKHSSYNSMGNDIVDINNDGLADIMSLDMNPITNYRKKMMLGSVPYLTYINNKLYNYEFQYVHNVLQYNLGNYPVQTKDSATHPIFGDIAYYSGIAETDWSWTPLVADFDNDGLKDMIITNGYPKDITDHDFINYRREVGNYATKSMLLEQIPQVPLKNVAYKNLGNLQFQNVSENWGFVTPDYATGAMYADLDNDGDLDLIVNNTNQNATLYQNNFRDQNLHESHYFQVVLEGDTPNVQGIGSQVELYCGHLHQYQTKMASRGYLSSAEQPLFFGLGSETKIDSLIIRWANGKKQRFVNLSIDAAFKAKYSQNNVIENQNLTFVQQTFHEITQASGIHFIHQEADLIDFNGQPRLPHKFSETSPPLAVGDFNEDGFEDFIVGGSKNQSAQLFFQNEVGLFSQKFLLKIESLKEKISKDQGLAVFDANGDGHLDVYIASGGIEFLEQSEAYQDKLYIGDGKGQFTACLNIPKIPISKACVRVLDFDNDGDADLFIAGGITPQKYPQASPSFLLINDTKNGQIQFTKLEDANAVFNNLGIVHDALVTDFNLDGWQDLIVVGEWMSPLFIQNNRGRFNMSEIHKNLQKKTGWWHSITGGDFNNDGLMDYVLGNIGTNSYFRASETYPLHLISADFDGNQSIDAFMGMYLPNDDGELKLYPMPLKDEFSQQLPFVKKRFLYYKDYAKTEFKEFFDKTSWAHADKKTLTTLNSVILLQNKHHEFDMIELPYMAQWSMLDGMVVQDFDADGNLDIVCNTNDFSFDPNIGRLDALNGLYLKGNGDGSFLPMSMLESGIYIPGNGKGLVSLANHRKNKCIVVSTENKGLVRLFENYSLSNFITLQPKARYVMLNLKNGKTRRLELSCGTSMLSQSSKNVLLNSSVLSYSFE
ncbi:MAG: VCBS repeat-containing protein [Alphaproteobacteria bacterium]|nr:VCBS repeat-containing protein [Alphaproteobacteria bacterium]